MAEYKDQPTKVPQLPAVPTDVSPNVRQWMSDIKEALEIRLGRRGDQKDRAVTLRELIESGLAKDLTSRPYDPNADSSVDFTAIEFHQGPEDLAVPPTPTSLTASAGLTKIILSWTDGWTQFGNHSYTEVYRHTSNSLGDAIIVGTTSAGMFTDNVDPLSTYYYWVRHVSTTDVKGPFSSSANATAGQVSSTFLADNSVIAAKIADGTIAGTKFASGIKPIEVVGSLPSAGTQGRTVFLTSDNKIYRDTGSAWTAAVPTSDLSGSIATSALSGTIAGTQIADDAITSAKIAANQVTASEIAANTITASQIASDTITAGQMAAGAIGVDQLAANAVTTDKIAAGTIVAGDIATGTITAQSAIIADAAIVTAKIADAAITTAKVNDANITTAKINDAAITAAKIATAQIDTGHLTNLYAHKLNGDVSKAVAGTLASTVTFENRSSTFNHVLTLSLPKPTHSNGWTPYANFNVNKMGTDKNSWYWLTVEMAIWNVNSAGGTSSETATSDASPNANGTGFSGAAVISNYLGPIYPSFATVGGQHILTIGPAAFYSPGTTTTDTSLIPTTSNYIVDSTGKRRQVSSITGGPSDSELGPNYLLQYSGTQDLATSGGHWFQESVASGATGRYNVVASIEWIAVDTAYNDFSIAGVWADATDLQTVDHGVKARLRVAGDSDSNGGEQASGDQYLYTATGLLMGVR